MLSKAASLTVSLSVSFSVSLSLYHLHSPASASLSPFQFQALSCYLSLCLSVSLSLRAAHQYAARICPQKSFMAFSRAGGVAMAKVTYSKDKLIFNYVHNVRTEVREQNRRVCLKQEAKLKAKLCSAKQQPKQAAT